MTSPPTLLASARVRPDAEAELRWYYCDAAGEMGERSSLGPMIDRLQEGRVSAAQSGTPDLPDRAYFAAQRARPIHRRLARLSAVDQTTLRAAYGPGLPAHTLAEYPGLGTGTLSPTLLLLTAQRTGIPRETVKRWLRGGKDAATTAANATRLGALRVDATMALTAAGLRYGAMLHEDARVRPPTPRDD